MIPVTKQPMGVHWQFDLCEEEGYAIQITSTFYPQPFWRPDEPAQIVSRFNWESAQGMLQRLQELVEDASQSLHKE